MSKTAISVEHIGKSYRLAHKSDGLRHVLSDIVSRPFRRQAPEIEKTVSYEDFWALKDITLRICQGEAVGFIGRNGSGKSTLLKILSRITEPTRGRIGINGRVSSLLEVGTGFHPELTGRENVFLNGAILGMSQSEIRKKFDEIVAFSEVEKFLDTPVKKYSSGMYVRLAFAVAAHLDPDVLIVDEVLAVGDHQFQQKCLAKMQQVAATEGRTVLFVSHSMEAVSKLCTRAVVLRSGNILFDGNVPRATEVYMDSQAKSAQAAEWCEIARGDDRRGLGTFLHSASFHNGEGKPVVSGGPASFEIRVDSDRRMSLNSLAVLVKGRAQPLVTMNSADIGQGIEIHPGKNQYRMSTENLHLKPGTYKLGFWIADAGQAVDYVEEAIELVVVDEAGQYPAIQNHDVGQVACQFEFHQQGVLTPA